jgi:hypothetical protein
MSSTNAPALSETVGNAAPDAHRDFSIVLGGPLFQILRKTHLADEGLALLRKRVLYISAFAWLPLLALSALERHLLPGRVAVPFLHDLELHVRFLVTLPLLIAAERTVHGRMLPVLDYFRERGVIPPAARERFETAVRSAFRLRNSTLAELALVILVYGLGIQVIWQRFIALPAATWYATPSAAGTKLTITGYFYAYASLPLFQFLLCRWYLRMFIWARFLWQTAKLPLSLVPTHPDRLAGLGFLTTIVYAFVPLAMAHGTMLAGTIANRIFFMGERLVDYKREILTLVALVVLLVMAPLLAFAPQLAAARRRGLREYGTLAERYVREFDAKWIHGGAPPGEPLLGSSDLQSLADLGNTVEIVRTMSTFPFSKEAVVRLAVATLVPIAPLALTMMPLEDLVRHLFGLLF